jgi:hypothetical protein
MQDSSEPNLSIKMVATKFKQSDRGRCEKQPIQFALILLNQRVQIVREREHEMEVGNGEEQFRLLLQPTQTVNALASWTVTVPARVRNEVFLAAIRTPVIMSAECRSSAAHDGRKNFQMMRRKPTRL